MAIVTTDNKHYQDIAAKIREKSDSEETFKPEGMAGAIDGVYEAGQKSMVDESKLVPTTLYTDGSYLRLDNVSEIPHDVIIFNHIYYDDSYAYGKNLIDVEKLRKEENWRSAHNNGKAYDLYLPQGTYTFSTETWVNMFLYLYKSSDDGQTWTPVGNLLTDTDSSPSTVTINQNEKLMLWIFPVTSITKIPNLQIEVGNGATPYEPYKQQMFNCYWDEEKQMMVGTVKSFCPTMTILGYYDGIGVQATYNKSYGAQKAYDEFWDDYQQNGTRTNYQFAFGGQGWNTTNFKPKYDMKPTGSIESMFRGSRITGDLVNICKDLGITLDFSKVTAGTYIFYNANKLTHLGVIDLSSVTGSLAGLFQSCSALHTVDRLSINEKATLSSIFGSCVALENITIDGVIGNNVGCSAATKLTHTSLMSIINHLKDYSGSSTTYTLTLGSTNLAKLTNEEKAIATQKGWTLA